MIKILLLLSTLFFLSDCPTHSSLQTGTGTGYVRIADDVSLEPATYTITAWLKVLSQPTIPLHYEFVRKGTSDGALDRNGYFFDYRNDAGTKQFSLAHVNNSNGFEQLLVNFTMTDSVWYHVAWMFTGTEQIIYVNGVEIGSRSTTNAVNHVGDLQDMTFGITESGLGILNFCDCRIDIVTLWNRGLTEVEVQEAMATDNSLVHSAAADIISYWTVGDGNGMADLVGNNDGILVGAVFVSDVHL